MSFSLPNSYKLAAGSKLHVSVSFLFPTDLDVEIGFVQGLLVKRVRCRKTARPFRTGQSVSYSLKVVVAIDAVKSSQI
jgi:hypothetical protein